MSNLAISIVTDRNMSFLKCYYKDAFICMNEFKEAAPIEELKQLFPVASGIIVEIGRTRIILRCSEKMQCQLNGEPMVALKPYPIDLTADSTLKIGHLEFNISPFISS